MNEMLPDIPSFQLEGTQTQEESPPMKTELEIQRELHSIRALLKQARDRASTMPCSTVPSRLLAGCSISCSHRPNLKKQSARWRRN
jgi:hypothetical protein